jgi:hypothetical protein
MRHRPRPIADRTVRLQRAALAAIVVLAVPALAACGGGSSAGSAPPAAAKHTPAADRLGLRRPAALVLRARDIGTGYLVETGETKRLTLAQELQHESAAARRADRRAWVGGYVAVYVWPGHAGAISQALVYRDAVSARITSTDRVGLSHGIRDMHGHSIKVPRSAPGKPRLMVAGSVKGLPLLTYGWQEGSVIELVAVFGKHVTVAQLMKLARTQDLRLTHPTFGA